jgi:aerobic-type carbon monoxide dehydrogenase small subunit (CoxS/CutS family)
MSPPTTVEILTKARALIAEPEHWCQKHWHESDGATEAWCAWGAVAETTGMVSDFSNGAIDALNAATFGLGGCGIVDYNDDPGTTHADILAAFDKAIAEIEFTKDDQ